MQLNTIWKSNQLYLLTKRSRRDRKTNLESVYTAILWLYANNADKNKVKEISTVGLCTTDTRPLLFREIKY